MSGMQNHDVFLHLLNMPCNPHSAGQCATRMCQKFCLVGNHLWRHMNAFLSMPLIRDPVYQLYRHWNCFCSVHLWSFFEDLCKLFLIWEVVLASATASKKMQGKQDSQPWRTAGQVSSPASNAISLTFHKMCISPKTSRVKIIASTSFKVAFQQKKLQQVLQLCCLVRKFPKKQLSPIHGYTFPHSTRLGLGAGSKTAWTKTWRAWRETLMGSSSKMDERKSIPSLKLTVRTWK